MIQIAILGFGTVGSGVYEVVDKNQENYRKKTGQDIVVKKILDIRDFENCPFHDRFTKKYEDILNDDEISVVVEVMGGLHPAYEYTMQALLKGKHVVTSNKELVATFGAELLKTAREMHVNYMFEASVGGGIPIIRPLHSCLAANHITEICGILNGTTNYILTQMIDENKSFDVALKDAQEKGYAERNPEADVEGYDACRKIAILSSLVFGKQVEYDKIYTEGISKIQLEDVEYVSKIGCVIKLLALSSERNGQVYARVCPTVISRDNQLSNVNDVFNAILIKGDAIGDVMFYGRGAGKLPTASAVIADVIDIVRTQGSSNRYFWEGSDDSYVGDYRELMVGYYVRIRITDRADAMGKIDQLFGKCDYILMEGNLQDELAFITPIEKDGELIKKIEQLKSKTEVLSAIRKLN